MGRRVRVEAECHVTGLASCTVLGWCVAAVLNYGFLVGKPLWHTCGAAH